MKKSAEALERPPAARRSSAAQPDENRTEADRLLQDDAKDWVRKHQDAALLGAFAVGVFIGAWMRS